jgi:predicted DNA-binding transcriptional regulator YafY
LCCVEARSLFNVRELSQTLSVSRRTIFRDLNLLRDAGVDVSFDESTGGYSLPKTFSARRRPLLARDLELIVFAVSLSLVHVAPDLSAATQEALAKLLSASDERSSAQAARLVRNCRIDLTKAESAQTAIISAVCHAMFSQRQIRVNIVKADRSSFQTKVSPYRLVAGVGGWNLIGRSSVDRRTVVINLAQIERIECTEDEYTIPPGFHENYLHSDRFLGPGVQRSPSSAGASAGPTAAGPRIARFQ